MTYLIPMVGSQDAKNLVDMLILMLEPFSGTEKLELHLIHFHDPGKEDKEVMDQIEDSADLLKAKVSPIF